MGKATLILSLFVFAADLQTTQTPPPPSAPDADHSKTKIPSTFKAVPGLMGVGVLSRQEEAAKPFTPRQPNASAAVIIGGKGEEPNEIYKQLKGMAPGEKFNAVFQGGLAALTYVGISEAPLGCEGNTVRMALFQGTTPIPQGIVWILPHGRVTAVPVAMKELSPTEIPKSMRTTQSDSIAYRLRNITVLLEKKAPYKLGFSVYVRNQRTLFIEKERSHMADDTSDFNLHDDTRIQVPVPVAAFELKPDKLMLIILRTQGYEGDSFSLLEVRGNKAVYSPDSGEYYSYCMH